MSRLSERVWKNRMLTENTKVRVYQACVLTTLYGNICEAGHTPNSFHFRRLRRILGITWQEHIPNKDVLERADIPSHAKSATSSLAWPCLMNGGWTYSKGWWACFWCKACRPSSSAVQGCLQARYQVYSDRHRVLGIWCNNWRQDVRSGIRKAEEPNCGRRRERKKNRTVDGEERASERKATDYHASTSNCLHHV